MSDPPVPDCGAWINPQDLPCTEALAKAEGSTVDVVDVLRVASDLLWAWSGRRFGPACPVTVRPCARSWCDTPRGRHIGDRVLPCDRRGATIDLSGPIFDVVDVRIDGDEFTDWRLDGARLLVRTDGDPWPYRQDLTAAATAPDTFAITFRPGEPIGPAGLRAVKVLSCELLKARLPGEKCALPRRVRTATRQGLTVDFDIVSDLLDKGRTGLDEVDHWLAAVNPAGLPARSSVVSVDRLPPRVV